MCVCVGVWVFSLFCLFGRICFLRFLFSTQSADVIFLSVNSLYLPLSPHRSRPCSTHSASISRALSHLLLFPLLFLLPRMSSIFYDLSLLVAHEHSFWPHPPFWGKVSPPFYGLELTCVCTFRLSPCVVSLTASSTRMAQCFSLLYSYVSKIVAGTNFRMSLVFKTC